MNITIDSNSGYCFGVEFAIQMAEDEMNEGSLYCLGDIVHNAMEVERLANKGLKIIEREDLKDIKNARVLIRAHGEPPQTYQLALENNIELIDASCPVVLKLQNRVKHAYDQIEKQQGQIVILGKKGHAEVIGLAGQTNNKAIVISGEEDLELIDFTKPIIFFSQTTKSTSAFYHLKQVIENRIKEAKGTVTEWDFQANDSICRQVSNREPQLEKFASEHDVILFVAGQKSSNGKALFEVCKKNNANCYFIENEKDIHFSWFQDVSTVGICGATSTPKWLMEKIKQFVEVEYSTVQTF